MSDKPTGSGFSVLDMAQEMAAQQGESSIHDLFKNHPVSGNIKKEDEAQQPKPPEAPPAESAEPPKKKPWTPSAEVMAELPELQHHPAVYTREELQQAEEDPGLLNIADESAKQLARDTMDELQRKEAAIEDAKARLGIKHFKIPEGPLHVRIHNAAIDPSYRKTQEALDKIFREIIEKYPEMIYEWYPGWGPDGYNPDRVNVDPRSQMVAGGNIIDLPVTAQAAAAETPTEGAAVADTSTEDQADTKIIIDKSQLPQVAWSEEELEKIRKARKVELNIIERADIAFSSIEDVAPNAMDEVLSQYERKTNSVEASLPASRYRATFTGLSYPEVLDLTNSNEMNNLDGERAKWTLAYRHIKNQSIGPWVEYRWYIDPETKQKVKIPMTGPIPINISEDDVFTYTKFDDFLNKTSFMDLEFILWKILCATAMDKEIISIDCHAILPSGARCNKSYDWIYSPNELLRLDSVNPQVLEEMRITGEATGDEIMKNFMQSPVNAGNAALLPHCGFQLLFGHASAKEYLDHVYSDIKQFEEAEDNDPTIVSNGLNYTTLTSIKGFLLPKKDGSGWYRITGSENVVQILRDLDEVDWQTVSEVVRLMMEPYQFEFALRDIVCPECGNRSSIPIESMQRMLFIVARSLSSVQVELKKS